MFLEFMLAAKLTYSPILIGLLFIIFLLNHLRKEIQEYLREKDGKEWELALWRHKAKRFDAAQALRRAKKEEENELVTPTNILDLTESTTLSEEENEELIEGLEYVWVMDDTYGTYEVVNYDKLSESDKIKSRQIKKSEIDYSNATTLTTN